MAKKGRRRGRVSKALLIKEAVKEYERKYPNFEGLLEFYVPISKDVKYEYDLMVVDRVGGEVVGVKICRVSDEIPPVETIEPVALKSCSELRVYKGGRCILSLKRCKEQEDGAEKIKQAVARLIEKIESILEQREED